MTAPARTLTAADFVLARLAEDEAAARAASGGDWYVDDHIMGDGLVVMSALRVCHLPQSDGDHPADAAHIARHDPARVLAQLEALRAVVAAHGGLREFWHPSADGGAECDVSCAGCNRAAPCPTLRALASIWRDHPAFDPSWAAS